MLPWATVFGVVASVAALCSTGLASPVPDGVAVPAGVSNLSTVQPAGVLVPEPPKNTSYLSVSPPNNVREIEFPVYETAITQHLPAGHPASGNVKSCGYNDSRVLCYEDIIENPVYVVTKAGAGDQLEVTFIADGLQNLKPAQNILKTIEQIAHPIGIIYLKKDFPVKRYPGVVDADVSEEENDSSGVKEIPYLILTEKKELAFLNAWKTLKHVADYRLAGDSVSKVRQYSLQSSQVSAAHPQHIAHLSTVFGGLGYVPPPVSGFGLAYVPTMTPSKVPASFSSYTSPLVYSFLPSYTSEPNPLSSAYTSEVSPSASNPSVGSSLTPVYVYNQPPGLGYSTSALAPSYPSSILGPGFSQVSVADYATSKFPSLTAPTSFQAYAPSELKPSTTYIRLPVSPSHVSSPISLPIQSSLVLPPSYYPSPAYPQSPGFPFISASDIKFTPPSVPTGQVPVQSYAPSVLSPISVSATVPNQNYATSPTYHQALSPGPVLSKYDVLVPFPAVPAAIQGYSLSLGRRISSTPSSEGSAFAEPTPYVSLAQAPVFLPPYTYKPNYAPPGPHPAPPLTYSPTVIPLTYSPAPLYSYYPPYETSSVSGHFPAAPPPPPPTGFSAESSKPSSSSQVSNSHSPPPNSIPSGYGAAPPAYILRLFS